MNVETTQSVFGIGNLLSGLVGSLATLVGTLVWTEWKRRRERTSMLEGIIVECDYNLSIIDEILGGVVNANGSFKRLSVDYFRFVREKAIAYSVPSKLLSTISRVIVDMDLYNMEADYVFNGQMTTYVYAGVTNGNPVCITRKPASHDITRTISSARDGVVGSMKKLKQIASCVKNGKDNDYEC